MLFFDEMFDFVILYFVVYNILGRKEWEWVIVEMVRVLRFGGILVVLDIKNMF